jgi:hypothetical protein
MPYRLEVFHDRECRDAVERLSLSAASDEVAERQAREIGWRCECAGESRVLVLSCRVDGEWVEVSRVGTRRYAATAMAVIDYYWTADGEPERCSVRAANLAGETCYHCAQPIDGVGIVLDSEDGSTYRLHARCAIDGCAGGADEEVVEAAVRRFEKGSDV